MNTKLNLMLVAAAMAGSMAWNNAIAAENRVRVSCDSQGVQDVSMDARFQKRRGRAKFDASFEAAPGGPLSEGDVLPVLVAGVEVGSITLETVVGGDVGGDLEFDTNPDEFNPFPDNFPAIAPGTSVVVGPMGCGLRP